MHLESSRFLFLDGQTTGLSARRAEMIEIGWSFSPEENDIQTRLIRPSKTEGIPSKVWKMTGLCAEELEKTGEEPEKIWAEILRQGETSPVPAIVIHYSHFEVPFLRSLHEKTGKQANLPWPVICTYRLGKRLFPDLPACTLRAMSGHFGFDLAEAHRARAHVAATQRIWKRLVEKLRSNESIETLADLQTWLNEPKKRAGSRSPRRYLLERKTRLEITEQPGVYEMLSPRGVILYVGKATCLRSRVNSYFTQRRSKRSQLNELVSQVSDVRVTPTATPLEAAILENDLIKDIQPQYNRCLRERSLPPTFVSTDLTQFSNRACESYPWGPFVSLHAFESLERIILLQRGELSVAEEMMLGHPPEEVKDAFECLLGQLGVTDFSQISPALLFRLGKRKMPSIPEPAEEYLVEASVQRKLTRAVRVIHEAHWLCRLLDCSISWQLPKDPSRRWRVLVLRAGKIVKADYASGPLPAPPRSRTFWRDKKNSLDLKTFDRMKIILTGLKFFAGQKISFVVSFSPTRQYSNFSPSLLSRALGPLRQELE